MFSITVKCNTNTSRWSTLFAMGSRSLTFLLLLPFGYMNSSFMFLNLGFLTVYCVFRRTREKWLHQPLVKIKVVAMPLAWQWKISDFCLKAQDVEEWLEAIISSSLWWDCCTSEVNCCIFAASNEQFLSLSSQNVNPKCLYIFHVGNVYAYYCVETVGLMILR